jgi:hypothetical protein
VRNIVQEIVEALDVMGHVARYQRHGQPRLRQGLLQDPASADLTPKRLVTERSTCASSLGLVLELPLAAALAGTQRAVAVTRSDNSRKSVSRLYTNPHIE